MFNGHFATGDALDVLRYVPNDSVDLIVTDPPYRVISGGTESKLAAGWNSSVLSKNDGKIFQHNDIKSSEYMPEFFRVLKDESHCYVMTNNLNLRALLNDANSSGFRFHNLLVWRKNTCTANRWYMKEMELVCLFYKGAAKAIHHKGSKQIFEANNPREKQHPTEKPVALFEHYVGNSSSSGDLVLDPFCGSGTLAVAAINLGRRWLCVEKDAAFAARAMSRISSASEAMQSYRTPQQKSLKPTSKPSNADLTAAYRHARNTSAKFNHQKEARNMGTYTITAGTLEELLEMADALRGVTSIVSDAAPVTGESTVPPKQTRRRKAEAPPPAQPAEAPSANPFMAQSAQPEAANPFPPSAPEPAPFAPFAADPHANAAAERPAVTKLKELLTKLSEQHGEPQVYAWCMQKGLGLSPSVTKEHFLSEVIHQQPDDRLEAVYKQGGGA
jgi:DNA modification methylase